MPLSIFVSSTDFDLKRCREAVHDALAEIAEVTPVSMESWTQEHGDPVAICLDAIQQSDGYLGMIAYYRGWCPESLEGKSITEFEYDTAQGDETAVPPFPARHPCVVFVPKPGTRLDNELREVARQQGPAEKQAQDRFRTRVMQKVISRFESEYKLGRRVQTWLEEIVQRSEEEGRAEAFTAAADDQIELPTEADLILLLADEQADIVGKNAYKDENVAWLLQGPAGYAPHESLRRLIPNLSESGGLVLEAEVDPLGNRGTLLALLGEQLETGFRPPTAAKLGERINRQLSEQDVILAIRSAHRIEGGIQGFLNTFWSPLAAEIDSRNWFKLKAIFEVVGNCEPPPRGVSEQEQSPGFPTASLLPPLAQVRRTTLLRWLAKRLQPGRSRAEIETIADRLLGEAKRPLELLTVLRDPGLWRSLKED